MGGALRAFGISLVESQADRLRRVESQEKVRKGGKTRKAAIGIGIVVVLALVICFVPLKTVAYTVMVDYKETELYDAEIQVPLEYDVSVFEDYDVWLYEDYQDYLSWQKYSKGYVDRSNWDFSKESRFMPAITIEILGDMEAGGWYDVYITFYFLDKGVWEYLSTEVDRDDIREHGDSLSYHKSIYLDEACDDYITFFAPDIDAENAKWFYEYSVEPATKTIIETEYRQVTKQRQETRYKKVTLLDYLLHY